MLSLPSIPAQLQHSIQCCGMDFLDMETYPAVSLRARTRAPIYEVLYPLKHKFNVAGLVGDYYYIKLTLSTSLDIATHGSHRYFRRDTIPVSRDSKIWTSSVPFDNEYHC
jgi:hypothetical protein